MKLLFLLFLIHTTFQKNILVYYSATTHSHFTFPSELAIELSKNHQVHIVVESKFHSWISGHQNITYYDTNPQTKKFVGILNEAIQPENNVKFLGTMMKIFSEAYIVTHEELQEFIAKIQPDLIIADELVFSVQDLSIQKNIPCVLLSSSSVFPSGLNDEIFLPGTGEPLFLSKMNYFERLKKFFFPLKAIFTIFEDVSKLKAIREGYGHIVDLDPFKGQNRFPFLSQSWIPFFYSTKLSPLIKYTGGTLRRESLEIEENLKKWLDGKKNVIYISFGSHAFLSEKNLKEILNGCLSSNYVLISIRKDAQKKGNFRIQDLSVEFQSKIRIEEWVNQQGVLSHPSIGLFVSHCGYQSILESTEANVPILGVPFFADQLLNSFRIEELGMGFRVNPFDGKLNREEISKKVENILRNKTMKGNIMRLNEIRKSYGGVKTGVEFVEFILKFGTKDFQLVETEMNPLVVKGLDVYFTLVAMFLLPIYLLFKLLLKFVH
jgi:hypothetical protein